MSSRSASTDGFTRSTPSVRCLASRVGLRHRPTPSLIQAIGSTLHVVGVCVNWIGKVASTIVGVIECLNGNLDGFCNYIGISYINKRTHFFQSAIWENPISSGNIVQEKL